MLSLLRPIIFWLAIVATATYMFRQNRKKAAAGRRHFLVTQGGGEFRPSGDEFSDAMLSVMMGGAVLDLRNAGVGSLPRKLDAMVVMGGVELVVPEDWVVQLDVRPMLGGARDARTQPPVGQGQADLVVNGRVLMGGLEVRSDMPQKGRAQKQTEQREAA